MSSENVMWYKVMWGQSPFILEKLFVREESRTKALTNPLYYYQKPIFY